MSTPSTDGLKQEIDAGRMRVGNQVQLATGLPAAASAPIYTDSNVGLAVGDTFPLVSNIGSTASAGYSIRGQATGSANELMHLTLVAGANATATIAGFVRVNVTDDAGVITTGAYYAPFYTLS